MYITFNASGYNNKNNKYISEHARAVLSGAFNQIKAYLKLRENNG